MSEANKIVGVVEGSSAPAGAGGGATLGPAAPGPGVLVRAYRRVVEGKRVHLTLLLLAALAAVGMYFWKVQAVREADQRAAQARTQLIEAERVALNGQADELLMLSAVPLSWAVRIEMLAGDFDDVDSYVQQLVKQRHVLGAVVALADGSIRVASDRKYEGQQLASVYSGLDSSSDQPTVSSTGEGRRVVIPIMGFEARLGTLVLIYDQASIDQRLPARGESEGG